MLSFHLQVDHMPLSTQFFRGYGWIWPYRTIFLSHAQHHYSTYHDHGGIIGIFPFRSMFFPAVDLHWVRGVSFATFAERRVILVFQYLSGWWFQTFFLIFHFIYGMSSFPLTFIFFKMVIAPPTTCGYLCHELIEHIEWLNPIEQLVATRPQVISEWPSLVPNHHIINH